MLINSMVDVKSNSRMQRNFIGFDVNGGGLPGGEKRMMKKFN